MYKRIYIIVYVMFFVNKIMDIISMIKILSIVINNIFVKYMVLCIVGSYNFYSKICGDSKYVGKI